MRHHRTVIHLRRVVLRVSIEPRTGLPFDLPAFAGRLDITLEAPVTIFVGENGSGKSTLLEGLAVSRRGRS